MKKLKVTKVIASLLIVASILTFNSIGVNAEWKQDSNGWWNTEGSSWSVGWKEIDGKWYYFGQDGYMVHDTTIDGYYLGADGAWIPNNSVNSNSDTAIQSNSNLDDITMKIDKHVYEAGSKEIKIYLTNNTNKQSNYDDSYKIEKLENNKWQAVTFKGNKVFSGKAVTIKPHETQCEVIETSDLEELAPGEYRIIKELCNTEEMAGFEIMRNSDNSTESTNLKDFTMKTEKSTYPLATEKVKVYISNNTNKEGIYGEEYKIEKFENNKWNTLDFKEDTIFTEEAIVLNSKDTQNMFYSLSNLKDFKKLTLGKYRIITDVNGTDVTAEFELVQPSESNNNINSISSSTGTQSQTDSNDIVMKTEKNAYKLGTKEIKVYITNNTNRSYDAGEDYKVEKFENAEWHDAFNSGINGYSCMAVRLRAKETTSDVILLRKLGNVKDLTAGKYRIVKQFDSLFGNVNAAAEFELK